MPRLYKVARHGGRYERTLDLFRHARGHARPGLPTEVRASSWGWARSATELVATLRDLREVGVSILTLGPVPAARRRGTCRWRATTTPTSSRELAAIGRALGFAHVEAGPAGALLVSRQAQADAAGGPEPMMQYVPILMVFAIAAGGGGRAAGHPRRSSRPGG